MTARPLLPALLLLAGCVEHRAALAPGGDAAQIALPGRAAAPLDAELVAAGPLPQSLVVSAWRRDADGALSRDEIDIRTPLPWWQRFPADLVSDLLLPTRFAVTARETVVLEPVPSIDIAELDRRARARGYAEDREEGER